MSPIADHQDVAHRSGTAASHPDTVLSRRSLMQIGSVLGGAGLAAACTTDPTGPVPVELDVHAPEREPLPPAQTPLPGVHEFFTAAEARTVAAVVDRILPDDETGPGATEAGVVNYIDAKLARFEAFAEPTYLRPPFAESYAGSPPTTPSDDVVPVARDQMYRYGPQSPAVPQETYRNGLSALDDYSRQRFDRPFADLPDGRQDQVLTVLDAVRARSQGEGGGEVPDRELDRAEETFGDVDPGSFFTMLRGDTVEGMFADPVYGGNRGLVGWTMVGYPGPQREYSPRELMHGTRRRAQSLDGLHPMNPGRPGGLGINPMDHSSEGVHEG